MYITAITKAATKIIIEVVIAVTEVAMASVSSATAEATRPTRRLNSSIMFIPRLPISF